MSGHRTTLLAGVADPRRCELIVDLLRLSADPHSTAGSEHVKGDHGAVNIRPHEKRCQLRHHGLKCTCWMRSLDELARCLRLMRQTERRLWYQVHERYIAAQRKPAMVTIRKGRPVLEQNQQPVSLVNREDLNRKGDGQTRMLLETWRPGLNPALVDEGVRWLAVTFQGSPELPVNLKEAA